MSATSSFGRSANRAVGIPLANQGLDHHRRSQNDEQNGHEEVFPAQNAAASGGRVYLTLTAAVPTDATLPIYYKFTSSNDYYNKLTASGINVWQTSNTLTVNMGIGISPSYWYVEFMDGAGNATVTKYPAGGVYVPLTQAD